MPQGGVFTLPSEFLLPAGRETSASLLPGEHLCHTLSLGRSTTHTLAAVDPALALPTGDLARPPRLGQDWSPCAASVVICGGHFLLPIHVSHSTASRGGTSEPQRVPTRLPASQSGGVSLLIRYHVEQRRGRALSGSGRPLARTSAGLARLHRCLSVASAVALTRLAAPVTLLADHVSWVIAGHPVQRGTGANLASFSQFFLFP